MYWLLLYEVAPDYLERRGEFRAEHLGLAEAARDRGELLLAGAVGEPIDSVTLLFTGDRDDAARAFAEHDPYVANGVVTVWQVKPWHVVVSRNS